MPTKNKMRGYKSGERQHVSNPVAKHAVRLQFVSDIKTFDSSASEHDTQNKSCGNSQEKVQVVSYSPRRTRTENQCPSHLLSLRNFPVLRVSPGLRLQPDGSVASWVSLRRGDALKDNPFSLRVDKVFTRHNESVASDTFLSLFESRRCRNPERHAV